METTKIDLVTEYQNLYLDCDKELRSNKGFRICIGENEFENYLTCLAEKGIHQPHRNRTLFGTNCKFAISPDFNNAAAFYCILKVEKDSEVI